MHDAAAALAAVMLTCLVASPVLAETCARTAIYGWVVIKNESGPGMRSSLFTDDKRVFDIVETLPYPLDRWRKGDSITICGRPDPQMGAPYVVTDDRNGARLRAVLSGGRTR